MIWEDRVYAVAPDRGEAEKVVAAIRRLFEEDAYLFRLDASERSISHRLGLHLTKEYPGWDVDCEYNRDGHMVKRLPLLDPCARMSDTEDGSPVYPDIIVHRRGTTENHLVIEIKKSTSTLRETWDLAKLKEFRDHLGYQHSLFLRFVCATEECGLEQIEWFSMPEVQIEL